MIADVAAEKTMASDQEMISKSIYNETDTCMVFSVQGNRRLRSSRNATEDMDIRYI